jgi:hypothetical protein
MSQFNLFPDLAELTKPATSLRGTFGGRCKRCGETSEKHGVYAPHASPTCAGWVPSEKDQAPATSAAAPLLEPEKLGRVDRAKVVRSGCVISDDGLYRYVLPRLGLFKGPSKGRILWVLVNPSTADGTVDDHTCIRCMNFSEAFGYADMHIVNMFGWRDTDPVEMIAKGETGSDLVGPDNDRYLIAEAAAADLVMVGWGAVFSKVARYLPRYKGRDQEVLKLLGREVFCLGKTKDGRPRHPLMLPNAVELEPFKLAA